ncbi:NnrU family protein [Devosia submarina]|uniref:NnrU family protein n=1 Tax=Devosia submarina TaxID=1173082 RepID=UPI000D3B05F2|nr:NnrU family protein [Devosia submarina]
MTQLLLAITAFLAMHVVPTIPKLRANLIAAMGRRTYLGAYSIVSLILLAWLVHAALGAEFIPLWDPAAWQAWTTIIVTPLGFFFLLAGLMSPNPASVSMIREGQPGAITTITRHPELWGFILWSGSHIVPNGDLRSLLLFGTLFLFAVAGIPLNERKAERRLGSDWSVYKGNTSILPFAAIASGRARPRVDKPSLVAGAITVIVTIWILHGGHAALFAVDPLALAGL